MKIAVISQFLSRHVLAGSELRRSLNVEKTISQGGNFSSSEEALRLGTKHLDRGSHYSNSPTSESENTESSFLNCQRCKELNIFLIAASPRVSSCGFLGSQFGTSCYIT